VRHSERGEREKQLELEVHHSERGRSNCTMWTTGLVLCVLAAHVLVDAMEYCTLGSSDLRVSKVCLGTMTWGQQSTPQEGLDQLDYAFSQGVNFLDTAEIYPVPTKSETQGDTDRVIARWLKTTDRSKVVLASKVAGHSPQLTYMPQREGQGTALTAKQIRASVESSLLRLETPYIDLLQLHWPGTEHYLIYYHYTITLLLLYYFYTNTILTVTLLFLTVALPFLTTSS
jgi:aryl-alcohol dehydrogenase-like predicted oxidoreductase